MLSIWRIKEAAAQWQSEQLSSGHPLSASLAFRAGADYIGNRPAQDIERALAQLHVPCYAGAADIFEVGALWALFHGKP